MFNMFKRNYNVYVTLNTEANGYGLAELLGTMDYHGIEHEFHVIPVGLSEALNGIERYHVAVKANKKQIEKLDNVLEIKTESHEIKAA